ncbi:hypothetical protein [Actinoallomurus vinaceus]
MNEEDRAAAERLRDRFAEAGELEPENAALSEILEDFPQLARFLVLRHIWPRLIDAWAVSGALERLPAGARLLETGTDRDDLVKVARSVAYDTAFGLLYMICFGRDDEAAEGSPGWAVMESTPEGELTGRQLDGLHEDLLSLDPSGREGADLIE